MPGFPAQVKDSQGVGIPDHGGNHHRGGYSF